MFGKLKDVVRDFMDERKITKMPPVERERIQGMTRSALSDPNLALSLAARILQEGNISLYAKLSPDPTRFHRVMEEAVRLQREINGMVERVFSKMFVPADQRQPLIFYQRAEEQLAQLCAEARQKLASLIEALVQEAKSHGES